jgi:hypothetical protein
LIDDAKKRAPACASQRFDELEVANRNVIEDEMVLRFEIDKIGDVGGSGALGLLRVTQPGTGRSDGFVFALDPIALKRARAEVVQ